MNRRDVLKSLAAVSGVAACLSLIHGKTCAAVYDNADELAAEIDKWLTSHPGKQHSTSLPFATIPVNMHVRPVAHKYEPKLDVLREQVKAGDFTLFKAVAQRLWSRYKPSGKNCHELKQLPKAVWLEVGTGLYNHKRFVRCLRDRISTPKYIIDIDELTNPALAEMFRGIIDIRKEIDDRHARAVGVYNSNMYSWSMDEYSHFTPLETEIKKDGYMLEIYSYISVGGVLYGKAPGSYDKPIPRFDHTDYDNPPRG